MKTADEAAKKEYPYHAMRGPGIIQETNLRNAYRKGYADALTAMRVEEVARTPLERAADAILDSDGSNAVEDADKVLRAAFRVEEMARVIYESDGSIDGPWDMLSTEGRSEYLVNAEAQLKFLRGDDA